MNSRMTLGLILLVGLNLQHAISHARAKGRVAHNISIDMHTPPARILVVDSQGRRAGADPAIVLSREGLPPEDEAHQYLGVLEEIPNTDVEVTNIPSGEPPYELSESTSWHICIVDGPAETYTVSLTGTAEGVCKLRIRPDDAPADGKLLPITRVSVLVSPGAVRLLRVAFNPPTSYEPVVERVVTATDLRDDLATACKLKQISSKGACRSLQAKASAAAASMQKGNREAARGQLAAFLKELRAQSGKQIKEPAVTILREEAEALLKTLNR